MEFTGFTITRTTATSHQREKAQSGTRNTLIQLINRRLWCINGKSEHVRSWIFILEVFPASCALCTSGNRTLGPQHCVAVGIRLMTLSRDEDTKVSRGTRKRRRLGPSAGRHAHRQRHKKNRVGSMNGVVLEATFSDTSTIRRHRRGLPVSFERDEREEGFSTDIARTKTTTNCI